MTIRARIIQTAKGKSPKSLASDLVESLDPDRHLEIARTMSAQTDPPSDQQIKDAKVQLIQEAVKPLYDPNLRDLFRGVAEKD